MKTQCVFVKTQCVFKSVFIFPINLRTARKYFGKATYLRTIFQIRRFLCLPGLAIPALELKRKEVSLGQCAARQMPTCLHSTRGPGSGERLAVRVRVDSIIRSHCLSLSPMSYSSPHDGIYWKHWRIYISQEKIKIEMNIKLSRQTVPYVTCCGADVVIGSCVLPFFWSLLLGNCSDLMGLNIWKADVEHIIQMSISCVMIESAVYVMIESAVCQ